MGIRSSTHQVGDTNAMVNRHLGEAYKDVKLVADNIENLEALGEALPYLESYLGVYANAPTQRKDGSPIQNGDFYFDAGSETMQYAYINESDVLTWQFVDPALFVDLLQQAEAARDAALAAQASAEHAVVLASDEVSKAQAEVGRAIDQVNLAKAEVTKAESHATAASGSAAAAAEKVSLAQAEVDKAALEVGKAQNEVANAQAEVIKAAAEKDAAEIHANTSRTQADRAQGIADSMATAEDDLVAVKDQAVTDINASTNNAINVVRSEGFDQRDQVASVGAGQQEMISTHADAKMQEITAVGDNQVLRVQDATAESETRLQEAVQGADSATAAAINEIEQVGTKEQAAIETKGAEERASLEGYALEEVQRATQEANRAADEANNAETEADRAKSEANRAKQVTGLDTVEDAIDLEMQNHNPYGAMTKAERDALREQRIRESNGSGFKEWGKHWNSTSDLYDIVSEGIWQHAGIANVLYTGNDESSGTEGVSNTLSPILNVDGNELEIYGAGSSNSIPNRNAIKFPDAPNGTKTLYGSEVRKYEDKPGIGELYDVMGVDFDGSTTWVKIPAFPSVSGAVVEFKFKLTSLTDNWRYLISSDEGTIRAYIQQDGTLHFSGLYDVYLNGDLTSTGSFTIEEGVEYHFKAFVTTGTEAHAVTHIGNAWLGVPANAWYGEIWDVKLEDLETGETRHFLPLQHHKVADGDLVQTKVANVAAYNPREGYVVNYDVDEGYALVPTFPLMDAMNISMALRTTSNDRQEFGQEVVGSRMRFIHDPENYAGFVMSFGSATVIQFDTNLQVGRTHYLDVQLRSNGDTTYRLDATIDGEHALTYNNIYFDLNEFGSFCLGAYSGGAGSHWQGQIYDFEIQYPDAPHLSRNYVSFDSEDPENRLFIRDEKGFTDEDWGVEFVKNGGYIDIPEWTFATGDSWEAVVVVDNVSERIFPLFGDVYLQYGQVDWDGDERYWEVAIDGVDYGIGRPAVTLEQGREYHLKITRGVYGTKVKTTSQIGALYGNGSFNTLVGSIRDLRLTDADNPANSRHYPLVQNSATQPTDAAPIVDGLYDEATAPFYTPAYNTSTRHAEIPLWSATDSNQSVSFKVKRTIDQGAGMFISAEVAGHYIGYQSTTGNFYWANFENVRINGVPASNNAVPMELNVEYEIEADVSAPMNIKYFGQYATGSLQFEGRIWDISLIDNTNSTNSRFYPSIIYSPDSVPTGTVLVDTGSPENYCVDPTCDNPSDWTVASADSSVSGGKLNVATVGTDDSAILNTVGYYMVAGESYNMQFTITDKVNLSSSSKARVRFGTNFGGNTNGYDVYIGYNEGVTNITLTPAVTGVYYTAFHVSATDGAYTIDDITITKNSDGTLVNFPSGSEWALAQVSGLTEGTPENFTGPVWNNDLPNTDAPMTQFTTPWVEYSTALHGEVVGNTTWAGMSFQASQKAFDYASGSDAEVIISRKDLSFIEVWDERVSDKGILCPYGSVQSSLAGTPLTSAGVAQGYSAYGEWDEDTVGNVQVVANMTEDELKAFHADPKNLTWWDPEEGEYWQTRYRIRTVEGLSDITKVNPAWSGGLRWDETAGDGSLWRYANVQYSYSQMVYPQGSSETSQDMHLYGGNPRYIRQGTHFVESRNGDIPAAPVIAIPLTLTQRLNQGAYHPTYNPSGCATTASDTNNSANGKWFASNAIRAAASTADCFTLAPVGTKSTSSVAGKVGGVSGADSQYDFYDAIYAGQVEDLRLSCNRHETSKLLEDAIRKAVRGEMRGKGKVPFLTKMVADVAGGRVLWNGTDTWAVGEAFGVYTSTAGTADTVTNIHFRDATEGSYTYNVLASNGEWMSVLVTSNAQGDDTNRGEIVAISSNFGSAVRLSNGEPDDYYYPADGVELFFDNTNFLSAEHDSLPWVDIIGDPERIAATFPDGVVGQWIPQIPDGSAETYLFNKKSMDSAMSEVSTDDDGATWSSNTRSIDTVTNSYDGTLPATRVRMWFYEALSDFTEAADSSKVVGEVGDVVYTGTDEVDYGNRLMPSVIGEIGKSSQSQYFAQRSKVTAFTLYSDSGELDMNTERPVFHTAWNNAYTPQNNSHAVKALYTLTEKDGLLYLQFHGSELKHNGTDWGDNAEIPVVDNESTQTDLNGNTVKTFCHHTMIPIGIASNK